MPGSDFINAPTPVPPSTDVGLGETVSFASSGKGQDHIRVFAYQNGVLVYGWDDAFNADFLLGAQGSQWLANGGPADCEAQLYTPSRQNGPQILATVLFTAAGS